LTAETYPKKTSKIGLYIAVAVVILIVAATGVFAYTQLMQNPTSSPSPSPTQSTTPIVTPTLNPSPTQSAAPTPTVPSQTPPPSSTQPPATSTPTSAPTPLPTATPSPTSALVNVVIYGGPRSGGGGLGFGPSNNSITSPGPTLTFKVGDNVTLVFMNPSSG